MSTLSNREKLLKFRGKVISFPTPKVAMIHGTKLRALHSDPSGSVLRRWRPRQFGPCLKHSHRLPKTPAGV
jgi:hypothetical protein